jgi:hypothetical protein
LEFCGLFCLLIFWGEQSSSRTKSACLGSLLPTYGVFLTSTENTIPGIFVVQYMQYMSVECKLNWDHITIVTIVSHCKLHRWYCEACMWEKACYANLVVGEEDNRMKNWSSSHLNFHLSTQTIGLKLVNHMSVKTCPGFGSVAGECHASYGA